MSERHVPRFIARLSIALCVALSFGALAIVASPAGAAKQKKPLRITNIHNTGYGHSRHTAFTAQPPRHWTVTRQRDCTAIGYDADGNKHVGSGVAGYGRNARLAFNRGVVVERSQLSVRCPKLSHTYYTTSYVTHWSRRYKSVHGTSTSSRQTTASCHINPDFGWLIVDCWGGKHATVTYRFHLPSDARGLRQWAHGTRGCCRNGHVHKSWSRSGGHITYRVEVTNWAGYTVKKVGVSYLTKIRRKVRHRHVEHAVGKGRRA